MRDSAAQAREAYLNSQNELALSSIAQGSTAGDVLLAHKLARAPWDDAWRAALDAVREDKESLRALLEVEPSFRAAYLGLPKPASATRKVSDARLEQVLVGV